MLPHFKHLSSLLGMEVSFCPEAIGRVAQAKVQQLKPRSVLLLENLGVDPLDVIFIRGTPASVKANLVGIDEGDRTPSGLRPSDHAGLFVRFVF